MTKNKKMTLEQMDHFLRHVEMHVNEFRQGSFTKGSSLLKKIERSSETCFGCFTRYYSCNENQTVSWL